MIGKILKNLRVNKNFKQSDLSKIVNIPQNTISQYENGKIQPTFEIIEKIANACDFKIEFKNKKSGEIITTKNIERKEI